MTDIRKDLADHFTVIGGQAQPRGHLTRFSAKRLAQLREQEAAKHGKRDHMRFDFGEVAAWLCIILGAIVLAWRHDTPTGGLALPSCAAVTVAEGGK